MEPAHQERLDLVQKGRDPLGIVEADRVGTFGQLGGQLAEEVGQLGRAEGADSEDKDASLGAVYNFRSWICETDGKDFTLITSGQITINNARGEEYASLVTGENSYVKLKKVEVRVTDGNGKELYTHDKGDMF